MSGTDLELLGRYRDARDVEAFAELVSRHRDMVYTACYRVLGSRSDAEDAAQECFLRLARGAHSVKTSVAGWLHRVAVRASVDLHRKNGSRRKMERKVAAMQTGDAPETAWSDIRADIDQAIDSLPGTLREAIVMHFLEGRPQTEIAAELGLSQPAVSQRVKRALEQLRRRLKQSGLAVSAGGLAALLTAHGSEAAPATLLAELGRIALAGLGSSSPHATAGAGAAAILATKTKIACIVAATVLTGAAVQQTIRGPARANQPDLTPPAAHSAAVATRVAEFAAPPEPVDERPAEPSVVPSPPETPSNTPHPPAATIGTATMMLPSVMSFTRGDPTAESLRADLRDLIEDEGAGAMNAPGVALRYYDEADPLLCTLITDVISAAKAALERTLPQAGTKDIRVYVVPQQGWHESTTTNRRDTIYIQPGVQGIGEQYRADAGPIAILCQAVAELYNPARIPGLDRYLTHAHLVPAVMDALGPVLIPSITATPLAADGAEMLDAITDDACAPIHPDFAAVGALRAIEERLGLDGLRALLAAIPRDADDPFAVLREAAVARDPALTVAFGPYDQATAIPLEPDGTCLIASFEDDVAFTVAPEHPLPTLEAPLVVMPNHLLSVAQSPDWATDGMLSLEYAGGTVHRWMSMGLWDPDWRFKDWTRFSKFEMDLMVDSPQPEVLRIQLHDDVWHGHGYVYVFSGTVNPGQMVHIEYPLNDQSLRGARTWEAPHFDGRFRASEVTNVEFMLVDPAAPVALYVDNLRLTPRTGDEAEAPPAPEAGMHYAIAPEAPPKNAVATGAVFDLDMQPLAGADVGVLHQWRYADSFDHIFTVTTDENGAFELDLGVEPERLRSPWSIWARHRDRGLIGCLVLGQPPAPDQPISILLTEGCGVMGMILDDKGNPLPDIETSVWLSPGLAGGFTGPKSDADGNFTIAPLPADIGFRLQVPYEMAHLALEQVWLPEVKLTPGLIQDLPPMFIDPDGRTVTGAVQDEAGAPVAGAKVAAFRPQHPVNSVLADEQGRFSISRLAVRGDAWLLASHPTQPLHVAERVPLEHAGAVTLGLRALTSASGQLCDAEGRPVPDADVSVSTVVVEGPGVWVWHFRDLPRPTQAKTDADGRWSIEGLVSSAPYTVTPRAPGVRYNARALAFRAGAEMPVDLGRILPDG